MYCKLFMTQCAFRMSSKLNACDGFALYRPASTTRIVLLPTRSKRIAEAGKIDAVLVSPAMLCRGGCACMPLRAIAADMWSNEAKGKMVLVL